MIVKKPWFKAKRYGYGWGLPLTWQGWLVFIIYFAFVIWAFLGMDKDPQSSSDILPFIFELLIASIILCVIAYLTGEKLKWRWGDKE